MVNIDVAAGNAPADELRCWAALRFLELRARIQRETTNQVALGGNLCILQLTYSDGREELRYAHSNYSALTQGLRRIFVPSVPDEALNRAGIPSGSQHANHTEPKLLYWAWQQGLFARQIVRMVIYSDLACCGSCIRHTISTLAAAEGLLALNEQGFPFIVVESGPATVRNGWELD